jgi:hypothetical protein
MKEILTCEIWTGLKIKVVIDRESGEFVLFNSRFRLDIQDKKAVLVDFDSGNPICTGFLCDDCWFFQELDYSRSHNDPYAAAIQILYDIIQYC